MPLNFFWLLPELLCVQLRPHIELFPLLKIYSSYSTNIQKICFFSPDPTYFSACKVLVLPSSFLIPESLRYERYPQSPFQKSSFEVKGKVSEFTKLFKLAQSRDIMDSGASEGKVFQIKSSTTLIFLFSSIACIMWKNVSSYALRQIEKSSFSKA